MEKAPNRNDALKALEDPGGLGGAGLTWKTHEEWQKNGDFSMGLGFGFRTRREYLLNGMET
jgi:hypothetical protein